MHGAGRRHHQHDRCVAYRDTPVEVRGGEVDATLAGRLIERITTTLEVFRGSVGSDEIDRRIEAGLASREQVAGAKAELIARAARGREILRQLHQHRARLGDEPAAARAPVRVEQSERPSRKTGLTQVKNSKGTHSLSALA